LAIDLLGANKAVDMRIYEEELRPWLPEKILDCHVHVSLASNCGRISDERRSRLWPIEVGVFQSWEELRSNYRLLFPDRHVDVLAFGGVYREQDSHLENSYVYSGLANPANRADALLVTRPDWDASVIETAMARGFLGVKPYPDLAPQNTSEVSIYDFLPKTHLETLNRLGAVLMLHLPRAARLGDPNNIRELLEIAERYPSIKLIVAHIGRAYCLPTAEKGLPFFADTPGVYFDTSANLNADVFELALETVGPDRLLFGSDLPVMMMRGVREHVGEDYINYTDGDYSWNTNRKSIKEEAGYTFYIYQEIRALIRAFERRGLGKAAFRGVLYSNAAKLLGKPVGSFAA